MKRLFTLALLAVLSVTASYAKTPEEPDKRFHLAAGLHAGLSGVTLDVAIPVVPRYVYFRTAASWLDVSLPVSNDAVRGRMRLNGSSAGAFLDVHPFAVEVEEFHFTAGMTYGLTPDLYRLAVTPVGGPASFNYKDVTYGLAAERETVIIQQFRRWRPYFGVGLKRDIPRSRFGLRVDAGLLMLGHETVLSDAVLPYDEAAPHLWNRMLYCLNNVRVDEFFVVPVLNVGVAYKIF